MIIKKMLDKSLIRFDSQDIKNMKKVVDRELEKINSDIDSCFKGLDFFLQMLLHCGIDFLAAQEIEEIKINAEKKFKNKYN
jgi:hypothetical protein